jgi:hypothetical protein
MKPLQVELASEGSPPNGWGSLKLKPSHRSRRTPAYGVGKSGDQFQLIKIENIIIPIYFCPRLPR